MLLCDDRIAVKLPFIGTNVHVVLYVMQCHFYHRHQSIVAVLTMLLYFSYTEIRIVLQTCH